MAVKTFVANKGANRARQSGEVDQSNGGDQHLVIGYSSPFRYWAYARFALDWTGVKQITKAELVVVTRDPTAHIGAVTGKSRAMMLQGNFDDLPSAASEAYHKGVFNVPPEYTTAYFSPLTAISKVAGSIARLNITSMVGAWAPKTVKMANGSAGLAKPNYGLAIEGGTGNAIIASDIYTLDPADRIKIELTYVPVGTPGSVLLDGPATPVTQIEGEFFAGTLTPGTLGDTIARVAIQLYLNAGVVSEAGTEAKWKYDQPASASDRETGAFSVPLPALLRSGIAYKWRARVQNQSGVWTPWTATTPLSVATEAPSLAELVPTGSLATLNAVDFGAHYLDANANMLLTYRVQVRTLTLPTDPDWDQIELAWDSGDVPASLIEQFPTNNAIGAQQQTPQSGATVADPASGSGQGGVIRVPYSGSSLGPGDYSFRMRATDDMGATSIWFYGGFTLTVGWEPDPGDNPSPLTGYARRHVKSRVLIRTMNLRVQRVFVSKATGGTFKLVLAGEQTAAIAFDATAATVKARLEAFAAISTVSVALVGTYYTVTFTDSDNVTELMTSLPTLLTGTGAAVFVSSTRAPGKVVAIIEDPTNLGVGEYFNSAGEVFFSLPAVHPQVSVIEPWEVHWAVEVFRGEGWKEIEAGIIIDFDATEEDVVFHGVDYLGLLAMEMDERFNPTGSEKTPAGLFPAAEGGSYYANKTIRAVILDQLNRAIYQPGSKLGFLTVGSVAAMDELVTIYSTFKQRLPFISGLIQSHRAGTGKRTRLRVRKTITGGYEFRIDDNPGVDRDNIRFEYGGLVQGFRVIPFGDYGTRVNAIGRGLNSLKVEYYIALTPAPTGEAPSFFEDRYGRIAKVNLWQDISDRNDLIRRAKQFAKGLGKLGKRVALGLRVGSLGPKDGWDIADSLLIDIKRGVVDTSRYGSGYWTCWGWSYRTFPDGHDDLTLSLLPREDSEAPDDDLIPSIPINPGTEWEIGYAPPVVGVTTGVLFYDASTGNTWELGDDGIWVIRAGPGVPLAPTGMAITSRAVVNPDGTTVANVRVALVPAVDAAVRATRVALTATPGVWDANQIIADVPLGETSVAIENVRANTGYEARAWTEDVYGGVSPFSAVVAATTALDVTAPAVPTALVAVPGIQMNSVAWAKVGDSDLDHYDLAISTDGGATYPEVQAVYTTILTLTGLTPGTVYTYKVRAVDATGNASAYTAATSATPRAVAYADLGSSVTAPIVAAQATADGKNTAFYQPTMPTALKTHDLWFDTDDGFKLYVANAPGSGANWVASPLGDSAIGALDAGKITTGLLNAARIAVGALSPDKLLLGIGKNLVVNPGFELYTGALPLTIPAGATSPLVGWRNVVIPAGVGLIEVSSALPTSGLVSLKFTSYAGGPFSIESALFPVKPAYRYTIRYRFTYSTGAGAHPLYCHVVWYNAAGAVISENGSDYAEFASTAHDLTLTAPALATSAAVKFINDGIVYGQVSYIDDVSVEEVSSTLANDGATVLIDDTGITISNGKLVLQDEFGRTAMAASGFAGSWQDFVALGLYNARFVSGVAGVIGLGRTATLPYWTVSNTSGASVATFLNPGVRFTWATLTDKKAIVSDKVPVLAGRPYELGLTYGWSVVAGQAGVFITVQWYRADGSLSATSGPVNLIIPVSAGTLGIGQTSYLAPDDAFTATITIESVETAVHSAANLFDLLGTWLIPTAESYPVIKVKDLTVGTAGGNLTNFGMLLGAWTGFPVGVLNGRYFRSDLGMEFYYDGTRWLSVQLFDFQFNFIGTQAGTSTGANLMHAASVLSGGSDIWLVDMLTEFTVAGGTALSALHKWVASVRKHQNATASVATVGTVTVAAGASSVSRQDIQAIGALLNAGTIYNGLDVLWTITGTPGPLSWSIRVRYRLVAV